MTATASAIGAGLGVLLVLSCAHVELRPIAYPETPQSDEVEARHGIAAPDPFRWLEADIRQDVRVQNWVEAQNQLTEAFLDRLPQRAWFHQRLTEIWDFEQIGVPVARRGRTFYEHAAALQDQPVLYAEDEGDAAPRALFDPNVAAPDGRIALADWLPSPDGARVILSLQQAGSDWRTIRVVDAATGEMLADELNWVKFSSLGWRADGTGFFYSHFPAPEPSREHQAPNLNKAIYLHLLGTTQASDQLIFATPRTPRLGHSPIVSDDGRWLLVMTSEGADDRYEVRVQDLSAPPAAPRLLFAGRDRSWRLAGSEGSRLFFVTDWDAPRYRVVRVDLSQDRPSVAELIPQGTGSIEDASMVGGSLIVSYIENAHSVVRRFDHHGRALSEVDLPGVGRVRGFEASHGQSQTFYSIASFNTPPSVYRYDVETGQSRLFRDVQLPFNPHDYVVEQRFFRSRDGTSVPMFLAHRRGVRPRNAPTLLYGYGGFGLSLTPWFSAPWIAWMDLGGVVAVANVRGGGEYGGEWHDAGRLFNKQNAFDDFSAAAEHLIAEGITSPDQLGAQGYSNGGMLVGAVVNQRPELFAAAVLQAPVTDMLRFDRFTAGRYWIDDYGDPADEAAFRNLYAYSPYHNIRGGRDRDYPAILVTTADTDDRVVPAHSFKYVAALQAGELGERPRIIRVAVQAGHGSGASSRQLIAQYGDMLAFAAYHMSLTAPRHRLDH